MLWFDYKKGLTILVEGKTEELDLLWFDYKKGLTIFLLLSFLYAQVLWFDYKKGLTILHDFTIASIVCCGLITKKDLRYYYIKQV